jgi:hypothetical protein
MPLSFPLPFYPPEISFDELQTSELLLTNALRRYALSRRDPFASPDWRDGLAAAAVEQYAIPAFAALIGITAAVVRRPLDVRCPHCPTLSPDEGRFLQLVGTLQRGVSDDAVATLAVWLPQAAARMAILPAHALARASVRGGLALPGRRRFEAASEAPRRHHGDPGLHLMQ